LENYEGGIEEKEEEEKEEEEGGRGYKDEGGGVP